MQYQIIYDMDGSDNGDMAGSENSDGDNDETKSEED